MHKIILLLLLSSVSLLGQQLSDFTQFRALQTIINPGAIPIDYFTSGNEPNLFVGATWRDQWKASALETPPSTKILRVDYFLQPNNNGAGLLAGGYIIQDQAGIFSSTSFYGKIAGVLDLHSGKLSVGLNVGVVQRRLRFRPSITGTSVGIGIQDDFSGVFPDVGFGVFYQQDIGADEDKLYMGFSVPQIFGFRYNYKNQERSEQRIQHYYYTFGLIKYFTADSFFEPSIWLKYVPNTPITANVNIRAQLTNHFWIGAGSDFTTKSALFNFEVGVLHEWECLNLRLGFGFGFPLFLDYEKIGVTQEYNLSSAFSID